MANYQITESAWLEREKARVKSVLTVRLEHNTAYAAADLASELKKSGLKYAGAELITIRDALIADGVIEIV